MLPNARPTISSVSARSPLRLPAGTHAHDRGELRARTPPPTPPSTSSATHAPMASRRAIPAKWNASKGTRPSTYDCAPATAVGLLLCKPEFCVVEESPMTTFDRRTSAQGLRRCHACRRQRRPRPGSHRPTCCRGDRRHARRRVPARGAMTVLQPVAAVGQQPLSAASPSSIATVPRTEFAPYPALQVRRTGPHLRASACATSTTASTWPSSSAPGVPHGPAIRSHFLTRAGQPRPGFGGGTGNSVGHAPSRQRGLPRNAAGRVDGQHHCGHRSAVPTRSRWGPATTPPQQLPLVVGEDSTQIPGLVGAVTRMNALWSGDDPARSRRRRNARFTALLRNVDFGLQRRAAARELQPGPQTI